MLFEVSEPIGKLIRRVRKERSLTQQALADRVGMQQSHLQTIEAGKTDVRYSTLRALLQALGLNLAVGDPLSIRVATASNDERRPRFQ